MTEESLLNEVTTTPENEPVDQVEETTTTETEHPEWFKADKYKSVEDQAKAYVDLEKQFGGFTGAPEDYEVKLQEGIDFELDPEDGLLNEFKDFAKEAGMNNDTFNKFVNLYAEQTLADNKALEATAAEHVAEQMKELGDKAEARLENVASWAKAQLGDEDLFNKFASNLTDAGLVEVFEAIMDKTGNASQATSHQQPAAPAKSLDEIHQMQFAVDEFGERKMRDPKYAAEVRKLLADHAGTKHTPEII
jgi:hypothetical protein